MPNEQKLVVNLRKQSTKPMTVLARTELEAVRYAGLSFVLCQMGECDGMTIMSSFSRERTLFSATRVFPLHVSIIKTQKGCSSPSGKARLDIMTDGKQGWC